MAKKVKEAETAEAGAEGGASRGKKVMITNKSTGEARARVDVIKELWNDGQGTEATQGQKSLRGAIVKILEEQYDHKVPYQIVFAATKPAKAEAAEAAEGEAAAA